MFVLPSRLQSERLNSAIFFKADGEPRGIRALDFSIIQTLDANIKYVCINGQTSRYRHGGDCIKVCFAISGSDRGA